MCLAPSLNSPIRFAPLIPDGNQWGGFAEMRVEGEFVDTDSQPPEVLSGITVELTSATEATISWSTSEPATTQLRYSTRAVAAQSTVPDLELSTEHVVQIQADSPLSGQIESRSTDAAGNRAQIRFRECVANGPTWLETGEWPPGGEPVEETSDSGCSCTTTASRSPTFLLLAGAALMRRYGPSVPHATVSRRDRSLPRSP